MMAGCFKSEVAIHLMPEALCFEHRAGKDILLCVSTEVTKFVVQKYRHSGAFSSSLKSLPISHSLRGW